MDIQNKAPIAVEHHSRLNLPFDHATTGMFMLLQPVYYRHFMKTERDQMKFTSVVRPNPLVVPTFGRIRQNLRHFFVPYRLVFPNWEEFKGDVIASNFENSSQVSGVPYFTAESLYQLFFTFGLGQYSVEVASTDAYDFYFGGGYFKLTRYGRYIYKILYSLGYDIVGSSKDFHWNALGLLAYARVYCDWYVNQQYMNDALYLGLQRLFKYNDPASPLQLSASDLNNLFSFVRPAIYNTNPYFEDAWDNPVSPNAGNYTNFAFRDITTTENGTNSISTASNGTPYMSQSDATQLNLGTDYLHKALVKLTEYQRRHAIAGALAIDRVLADYGIQTDYLRLNRSIYVGVSTQDVDINSIYATANGSNNQGESVVGDFAGAGFGAGQNSIDFKSDEEGVFLTISTIQPSGGYFQGYDRNNRHLTREQFFTPSFDSLGVQSIEKGEVYVSRNEDFTPDSGMSYANHFGFTGRYGEMKRSISRVSGDFAFPSVLQGGSAWHLMRKFDDTYFNNSVANVVHSQDFARGTDAEQYLRLFTYTEYEIDPFNLFLHVDCVAYAPCKPFTDSYDWETESQTIALDSTGSKVN